MSVFTAFDIVVLLLIVLGGFAGLARGFVTEVLSLLAWVAAIFAVRYFYPSGQIIASKLVSNQSAASVLAFAVIFIVAFVVFRSIAGSLGSRTRNSVVGPLDRLLGLGFGAFKGLLGASVLYLLATMVFDVIDPAHPRPEWLRASRTAPLVELTSKAMVDFVEERRHPKDAPAPDKTAPDKTAPDKTAGYNARERGAFDRLLDAARGK